MDELLNYEVNGIEMDREYLEGNYFDTSLAEGKVFTIYAKETGEILFERPLDEFTNEDALDLELNASKSSDWQRFEITDKERNVLVMGDVNAFEHGLGYIRDILEYQEKAGGTGYKPEEEIIPIFIDTETISQKELEEGDIYEPEDPGI